MATSGLIDVNLLGYYNSKLQNGFTTNELEANRAKIKIAEVTESLTAASASFSNIGLSRLTVTGKAIVQNLDVNNKIASDSIQTSTLNSNYISANNSVTTPLLEATSISASQISAGDKIQAPIGEFETLKVDNIEADSLGTEYLKADGANITEAMIKRLFVDTGIFEEAIIKDGYVTGYLDAVHIRADSIVANKISLLGPDGLYYALNTEGATEGQTLENALDGSHIIAESITASKIRVSDLVAFGATIGGWTIDDTALRSRLKQAYDDAIPGVYFGSGLTKVEDYLTDENGNRLTDEDGNDLYLLKTKQIVKYLSDGNGNYITDENGNLLGVYVDDESAYTFGFLCDDTDSSPSRLLLSSEGIDIRTPNFVVNRDTGAVFVNGSITIAETGEQLTDALDDAEKVATNYMSFESNYGLMIADMTSGIILPSAVTSTDDFKNVLIDSDSVDIRIGTNVLASFGGTTTIGRSNTIGDKYIKMSPYELGIYKKISDGESADFKIISTEHDTGGYGSGYAEYESDSISLVTIYLGVNVGYNNIEITVTHPNGTSTVTINQNLNTVTSGTTRLSFTPDTGSICEFVWDIDRTEDYYAVKIYIEKGTDSAIVSGSEFDYDYHHSGGYGTALYFGGNSLNARLSVPSWTDGIWTNGRVLNASYGAGETFIYSSTGSLTDYWITYGYITNSKKRIQFSVTLPHNVLYRNPVTVRGLVLAIRCQNTSGAGCYVGISSPSANGEKYAPGISGITVTAGTATYSLMNTITFNIENTSTFTADSGTLPNNVPLAIRIVKMAIVFEDDT